MFVSVLPELSRLFSIDQKTIPLKEESVTASQEECEALARRFRVKSIESLKAKFSIASTQEEGIYKLEGTVLAHVTQTCVATFVDLPLSTEESFVVFLYEPSLTDKINALDITDERDFEEISAGRVDVGELVAQYLALALDPYPRQKEEA